MTPSNNSHEFTKTVRVHSHLLNDSSLVGGTICLALINVTLKFIADLVRALLLSTFGQGDCERRSEFVSEQWAIKLLEIKMAARVQIMTHPNHRLPKANNWIIPWNYDNYLLRIVARSNHGDTLQKRRGVQRSDEILKNSDDDGYHCCNHVAQHGVVPRRRWIDNFSLDLRKNLLGARRRRMRRNCWDTNSL